eukprot:scaffold19400_cov104-Isochrysis_galbana.AAC.5
MQPSPNKSFFRARGEGVSCDGEVPFKGMAGPRRTGNSLRSLVADCPLPCVARRCNHLLGASITASAHLPPHRPRDQRSRCYGFEVASVSLAGPARSPREPECLLLPILWVINDAAGVPAAGTGTPRLLTAAYIYISHVLIYEDIKRPHTYTFCIRIPN